MTKPMVGDYRRENLFTLWQCLMAYRNYQRSGQRTLHRVMI